MLQGTGAGLSDLVHCHLDGVVELGGVVRYQGWRREPEEVLIGWDE